MRTDAAYDRSKNATNCWRQARPARDRPSRVMETRSSPSYAGTFIIILLNSLGLSVVALDSHEMSCWISTACLYEDCVVLQLKLVPLNLTGAMEDKDLRLYIYWIISQTGSPWKCYAIIRLSFDVQYNTFSSSRPINNLSVYKPIKIIMWDRSNLGPTFNVNIIFSYF